uniref:N-acetyltransferase domain-containing protein n=1 Tax=Panagrellus redivivus TaxID=6233 RepID=A0A7E4ULF3_PANRE
MLGRLIPRLPTATQIAKISADAAKLKQNPLRRVEKGPDGFYHHSDPLSREILLRNFTTKKGRVVDIVRADHRDRDMVAQYFGEEFSAGSNCCRHLGMTFKDFETMAGPGTDMCLEAGEILMVFEGDKLVATLHNSNHTDKEFPQMFNNELPGHPNPTFNVKDNYADLIASYKGLSPSMDRFMALLDVVQPQTGKFLPKGVKKFGIAEAMTVHPSAISEGIGRVLMEITKENFRKLGMSHVATYTLAAAGRRNAQQVGYKSLYTLPYTDFKENGKIVYENMHDGATVVDALLLTIKN